MTRMLLATTALVALFAAPAFADSAPAAPANSETTTPARDIGATGYTMSSSDALASKAMGAHVYSSTATDAADVGTIKDLVMGNDGMINAAVLSVGGFLGVGEKNVAVRFSELKWSKADDGSWRYVLNVTKEAMTAAPDFKWPADNGMTANTAMKTDAASARGTTAMTPPAVAGAKGNMAATDAAMPLDRSTMKPMDLANMKADDLKGDAVMAQDNQEIGKIGDFVLTKDGKVDAVIVDVGGWLGIGSKPVAVAFNAGNFATDQNGKTYLFLNVTKEQLNAQPAYNKDTYTADRAAQRMTVNS